MKHKDKNLIRGAVPFQHRTLRFPISAGIGLPVGIIIISIMLMSINIGRVIRAVILVLVIVVLSLNTSICTGDYEGDPDAKCVPLLKLKK